MPRAAFTEGVSDTDPHASLEKVLDEDNLKWVEQQNKVTVDRLGEIRGTKTYERILEALDSKDKIPAAYEIGDKLYNFWQDDQHVQGIWRRASLDSYKSDNVEWETVLDIDALPPPTKDTAKTWVWHGSNLLDDGNFDRCLISLSPGGSDADTTREFCLKSNSFVEGGFEMLEPAKSQVGWRSRDEVLVGTDFDGDGECLTDSGYPRVCRSWKRGTPLSEAKTVFEGEKSDISASQYAYTDHGVAHEFRVRSLTFYTVRARRPRATPPRPLTSITPAGEVLAPHATKLGPSLGRRRPDTIRGSSYPRRRPGLDVRIHGLDHAAERLDRVREDLQAGVVTELQVFRPDGV